MERTSLEEADVVYASDTSIDLVENSAEILQNEGYDVTYFSAEDVEETEEGITVDGQDVSVLEDSTVFYAEESYLNGDRENREQERENIREVEDVAQEFVNPVSSAEFADDKLNSQRMMERRGIDTPRMFTSAEELNRYVEDGGTAVTKSRKGSQGSGFEVLEETVDDLNADAIYQEAIDQTDENIEERRGFMVDGIPVAIESRSTGNDKIEAQNIAAGGDYSSAESISHEEVEDLGTVSGLFGDGVTAIDYFKDKETGEITVLEANKTPGTGINSESDEDIHRHVATYLASTRGDVEYSNDIPESIDRLIEKVSNLPGTVGSNDKRPGYNHRSTVNI